MGEPDAMDELLIEDLKRAALWVEQADDWRAGTVYPWEPVTMSDRTDVDGSKGLEGLIREVEGFKK